MATPISLRPPSVAAPSSSTPIESKRPDFQANPKHLDGVPDMSQLIYLEGDNILHNLDCRYRKDEIYTSISKVLIAINPYQSVDIYAPKVITLYRRVANKRNNELPPHVFSVSQAAHYQMLATQTNQSMIVCGESGSGKTESAKHLMRYLAYTDGSNEEEDEAKTADGRKKASIEKQVLDANPILEAFGNAKTVLNNNSSRFGKFTKLVFTQQEVKEMTDLSYCANIHRKGCPIIEARIVGSYIETYLLEKSRVVQQDLGERNYHIFYALCAGGLAPALFTSFKLAAPETFYYLNQSKCVTIDGQSDSERLTELRDAMDTLLFQKHEQDDIFRLVAGILHLGNVNFLGMGAGGAPSRDGGANDPSLVHPKSKESMASAAEMFQVEVKALNVRLTTRNMVIRQQVITKPLSKFEAEQNRDAMSKTLYSSLFNYIVTRINDELFLVKARQEGLKWIGILDVFGFESFEHNSFEQFCINFANERLQQYFNRYILRSEQDEYILEAIMWTPIAVPDNQDTIDLVDKKTTGILAVLDSACKMPKGDDKAFVQNLFTMHPKHVRLAQITRIKKEGAKGIIPVNAFSIVHYAGTVIYNAKEFLSKNADFTSPDTMSLFAASKSPIGKVILIDPEEKSALAAGKAPPSAAGATGLFKSTGSVFSSQLNSLMTTLYDTTPHFVRCIKPNKLKRPGNFSWDYVRPQLECGGIIDALRILKCGYPTRCTYEKIFQRYGKILVPSPPNLNKRDFCEAILRCAGETLDRKEFQLGLTKVFFRPGKQAFLETLLEEGNELDARTVRNIRRFMLNKRFFRVRGAIRCFLAFNLRLRKMRALRWVVRTFRVANVICGTMFASVNRTRLRLAASSLQAYANSTTQMRYFKRVKKSVLEIETFYRHNKLRKPLIKEIQKRIVKKRALTSEKERKEKEQREIERREKERRDREDRVNIDRQRREAEAREREVAAEREAERQRRAMEDDIRAKEKERLDRETRMAELQVMEQETKALRLRTELLEREAETKEKVRAEQDAARAIREKEEVERALQRAASEAAEAASRAATEAAREAARLAAEAREAERLVFERKIAELHEQQKIYDEQRQADGLASLLTKGATFALLTHATISGAAAVPSTPRAGVTSPAGDTTVLFQSTPDRPKPNLLVTLSEAGLLLWAHKDEKSSIRAQTDGSLSLDDLLDVVTFSVADIAPSSAPATFIPGTELRLQLVGRHGLRLTLEAITSEQREQWATALRYALRNWRQLNTISRPIGDIARGNGMMAQLAYRADQIESWLHASIEHERREKEALRHEIAEWKSKLDDSHRDRDSVAKERDEWHHRHTDAIDNEKKTRALVDEAQQQLRERERKIEDMAEQRAESERKMKENAELMVKSAGDFSGVIQDFSARLKREVGEKDEQIVGLKARIRESEDDATRRRTDLERERREFDEKRAVDRSERERDIAVLREEKIRQNEELISLRARQDESAREVEAMKAKLAEANDEVAQVRRGRQALDEERTRREKLMTELQEGMEVIKKELDGTKAELSTSRKELEAKNAEVVSLKTEEKNRVLKPGAPMSLADNRRLKDLEDEKLKLQNQLKILAEKTVALEQENSRVRMENKTTPTGELQRQVESARIRVNEANSKVMAAERELERRKDSIKTVMKQVAEHEETLRNTTTTIQALGIEGKIRDELLADPTALRLFDLRQKQLETHAEAKACLLREYAAMVHEAEELNKTREDLDQKQLEKAKHEARMGLPRKTAPPIPSTPPTGLVPSSSFSTPQRSAARSIDNGASIYNGRTPVGGVTVGGSMSSPGYVTAAPTGSAIGAGGTPSSVRDRVALAESAAAGGREKKDDGCVIS